MIVAPLFQLECPRLTRIRNVVDSTIPLEYIHGVPASTRTMLPL